MAATGAVLRNHLFGVSEKDELNIITNGDHTDIYTNLENLKTYQVNIEQVCLNPKKFKKIQVSYAGLIKQLQLTSVALQERPTRNNYLKFTNVYSSLTAGLFLTAILGRHMSELLKQRLSELYPKSSIQDLEKTIGILTYPQKSTPLTLSQTHLLELASRMQKSKITVETLPSSILNRSFKKTYRQFRAVPVNFNEDPWSENDTLVQLHEIMKTDCEKELQRIHNNHALRVKQMKLSLKKLEDKRAGQIARILQTVTTLNEQRKFAFCNASLAYRPLFISLANKHGISHWRELWKLTPEEIDSLAYKNNSSVLKKMSERKTACIVTDRKLGYRVLDGRVLKNILKQLTLSSIENKTQPGITELKGMIANPGKVRGPARVILGSSDFYKFKTGDIIVTAMTSVDFVPLMKRAAAFVTNEGGITSHASIVARELNKPCIIGTKNGTQIFKDGDIIEVDANKGIVKRIK